MYRNGAAQQIAANVVCPDLGIVIEEGAHMGAPLRNPECTET